NPRADRSPAGVLHYKPRQVIDVPLASIALRRSLRNVDDQRWLSFRRSLLSRSRLRAGVLLLLRQLAGFVPPAPFADQSAIVVFTDRRLLAILMPPDPGAFGDIVLVFARGSNLAVLVPESERAGLLAVLVRTFHLRLAVGVPRLGRTVSHVL